MSNKELTKIYQESLKQRREKQTKLERALEGTMIAPITDKIAVKTVKKKVNQQNDDLFY